MELKVSQCQVGRFNLCSNEETLSFYMGIYVDNKIVEVNGVTVLLHFNGDPNEKYNFEDANENLEYIFEKCLEYSKSIVSSTDYKAQCLAFAKVYSENYSLINTTTRDKNRKQIEKQIERLQKDLTKEKHLPDDLTYYANKFVQQEIDKNKKWLDGQVKDLEQIKEGTDKYEQVKKQIAYYQNVIDKLSSQLITETIQA